MNPNKNAVVNIKILHEKENLSASSHSNADPHGLTDLLQDLQDGMAHSEAPFVFHQDSLSFSWMILKSSSTIINF